MEDEVRQVLADYYRDFSALEVHAILRYFHEPFTFIGPQGVFTASRRDELTSPFGAVMEELRNRGYGRSELNIGSAKLLSATAAIVTGIAVRYKSDGQELERVGITYVMHNSDAWRIAVLIMHDH